MLLEDWVQIVQTTVITHGDLEVHQQVLMELRKVKITHQNTKVQHVSLQNQMTRHINLAKV